jgi:hypothetical protein
MLVCSCVGVWIIRLHRPVLHMIAAPCQEVFLFGQSQLPTHFAAKSQQREIELAAFV